MSNSPIYDLPVNLKLNLNKQISARLLKDFNEFKRKNELIFCTMHQSPINGNKIEVTWTTTIRFNETLLDTSKIEKCFNEFVDENEPDICQITKMTCQDNVHVLEFSLKRNYQVSFSF